MVDFLKAFPFMSIDDYKWKLSSPMIRLMLADNTRVNYLSEKQLKHKGSKIITDSTILKNDIGIPIIGFDK